MGLSSKKVTSKQDPVFKGQLLDQYNNTNSTYQNNRGTADDISGQFAGLVPQLLQQQRDGDPTINAAQGYAGDVLGGKFLNNNPYLQDNIDRTNDSVANQLNARIGLRGQTGGSAQYEGLSKNLAENESRLRWEDYAAERQNMNNMAALSPSLAAGQQIPLAAAMAAGESAVNLPWVGANNAARNTAGLLGQYTNQEQKQSGGFLGDLILAGVAAAPSFMKGSDPALKENVERIGTLPDGLGVYSFDYKGDIPAEIAPYCPAGRQTGVMADEVAVLRPWALGPTVAGYQTVDYGALQ